MPLGLLPLTLPTPEENLAADEALLTWCAANNTPGALRFWESPTHFVVLGHSNHAAREADLSACNALGLPVLRRCSGGGAVVQGPGCLNYSLILRIQDRLELAAVPSTNRFIMETLRQALQPHLPQPIEVRGITDLAANNRKFSGNAQKRARTHLLFHGTFLLHFDLPRISQVLQMPSHQPTYRTGRPHSEFVMNLNLPEATVVETLSQTWDATTPMDPAVLEPSIQQLMQERYSQSAWHAKF